MALQLVCVAPCAILYILPQALRVQRVR